VLLKWGKISHRLERGATDASAKVDLQEGKSRGKAGIRPG
jgi:hypothetical protein